MEFKEDSGIQMSIEKAEMERIRIYAEIEEERHVAFETYRLEESRLRDTIQLRKETNMEFIKLINPIKNSGR